MAGLTRRTPRTPGPASRRASGKTRCSPFTPRTSRQGGFSATVPASDRATITEHIVRHGDVLTVVSVVDDPIYLEEPLVRSTNWRQNLAQQLAGVSAEAVDEIPGRLTGSCRITCQAPTSGSRTPRRSSTGSLRGGRDDLSGISPEVVQAFRPAVIADLKVCTTSDARSAARHSKLAACRSTRCPCSARRGRTGTAAVCGGVPW